MKRTLTPLLATIFLLAGSPAAEGETISGTLASGNASFEYTISASSLRCGPVRKSKGRDARQEFYTAEGTVEPGDGIFISIRAIDTGRDDYLVGNDVSVIMLDDAVGPKYVLNKKSTTIYGPGYDSFFGKFSNGRGNARKMPVIDTTYVINPDRATASKLTIGLHNRTYRFDKQMQSLQGNKVDDESYYVSLSITLSVGGDAAEIIDTAASSEAGENSWMLPVAVGAGVLIGAGVISGRRKKKAAGKASGKDGGKPAPKKEQKKDEPEKEEEEEDRCTYAMSVMKRFGDTLHPGEPPQQVFARIIRISPDGSRATDPALTSRIYITGDGYLEVSRPQMQDGYMSAYVSAPDRGDNPSEAVVKFRSSGAGRSFVNRLHFKVAGRQIIFAQDNLTLPACYDKVVKLPFFVSGMDDGSTEVSVRISGEAYGVSLEKGGCAGLWYAIIEERKKTVGEPGKYEPYFLYVTAKAASDGPALEDSLPVYRFNMGLVFNTEAFMGCYLEEYDVAKHLRGLIVEGPTKRYAPAHTKFSFSVLSWNEETNKIVRLLPDPKSITLKAVPLDAESDAESTDFLSKETREMSDQELIDKLGVDYALTNVLDDNSVAGILYPHGVLDAPARRKVNLVLEMKAGPQDTPYRAEQTIWLTSQPLRQGGQDAILQAGRDDEPIIDNLNHIISYIKNHNLVRNLFPVMKMAEMMLDGYDMRFGFDPSQVYTVQSTFLRFLRGETLGANADPEKVQELGLMAELMQMMAVTGEQAEQWFDTHGGFARRLQIGVLTLGWSEIALSAMRIPREMINVVMREKNAGGSLEAFCVGVKIVAIDFATEKVWMALGKESMKALDNFRPDLAQNIAKVAGEVGGKAKKALGVLGKDISLTSLKKACTDAFGKKTAAQLKGVKSANAAAKAEAEAIITKHRRTDVWTPEELAEDAAFREQNIAAIEKVKKLEHAYHENYMWKSAETEAAFAEAVYEVQVDKLAQKQLDMYNGTYAYNIRSKYYQKLTADYAKVDKLTKQKVAAKLGVSEDDIEIFCASNSDSRRQFNGETITRDRDVTVAVKGKPTRNDPNPLSHDVSQDVAESAYNSSFKEVTGYDAVLADQAVVQSGSKEMIGAGVDDLERSFKKGRFGESLDDVQGVADAMQHKPSEWFEKGAGLRSEGKLGLAQGNEEEGIRQIHKLWGNSVDPRSTARGNSSLITRNERTLYSILDHIEVVHQGPKSISVVEAKKILMSEYGMSLNDAAALLKEIVLRVEQ